MSSYKQQEYDFIERTKKILEQYDNIEIHENEKYEVTLLLNCMVGLLILPQQNWFDSLPDNLISVKDWGINKSHISFIKSGETKTVKDIARHLRNSISHYRFKAFDNSSKKISRIQFLDYDRDKNKTFEALIPIGNLKSFTNILTDYFMSRMEES